MPTPSEQKALAFLAFVLLLGGAVRILRAGPVSPPSSAEQIALAVQTDAAENAATSQVQRARRKPRMSRSRRHSGVDTVAGVVGIPFSDARPDRTGGTARQYNPRDGWVNGYPPPSPRYDSDARQSPAPHAPLPGAARRRSSTSTPAPDAQQVDLDAADAVAIDGLPRIGPALAARLVANRDSFGPFRSLEGLRRVRGMGPATIQQIAPRVTFSGRPASSSAGSHYH